jgi:hypothetical protein
MPVKVDEFKSISPCSSDDDTGCFMSWMTFHDGYIPDFYDDSYMRNAIHNPITFNTDSNFSDIQFHKGIVTSKYKLKYEQSISGRPAKGLLWVQKPQVAVLKHFVNRQNWHSADFNLFWVNVRENVQKRCDSFLEELGIESRPGSRLP